MWETSVHPLEFVYYHFLSKRVEQLFDSHRSLIAAWSNNAALRDCSAINTLPNQGAETFLYSSSLIREYRTITCQEIRQAFLDNYC